ADAALLRAKELGKTRVQVFDDALRNEARSRRHTEADLRRALERDELRLHYQPVCDLRSGDVHAVEALLRWEHPERGLLAPRDFLPVAERLGAMVDIGRWVVARACEDRRAWGADVALAINLSARELADPGLADAIAAALDEQGADPRTVSFELTETSIVAEPEGAVRALAALQRLGCAVAIDDFGKG